MPDEPTPADAIRTRQPISEHDYERLRQRWEKKYAGTGHAHKVQIMERGRSGKLRKWRPPLRNRVARHADRIRLDAELAVLRIQRAVGRG